MTGLRHTNKPLVAIFIAAFWLIAGFGVTLFLDTSRLRFDLDSTGVNAAPRDSFQIGLPILLHQHTNTIVTSGRLIQISPKGKHLTGAEARRLLEAGEADLVLERVHIETGAERTMVRGRQNRRHYTLSAPILKALIRLKFATLSVRNARISLVLPSGHVEQILDVNLSVSRRGDRAISGEGTAYWRGQTARLSFSTAAVESDGTLMPVQLALESPLLRIAFNGHVARKEVFSLEGDSKIEVPSIVDLARALGAIVPDAPRASGVALSGPLSWTDRALSFDRATVDVGAHKGVGAVSLKHTKDLPQLSGTLAFEELDLSNLLNAEQTQQQNYLERWWRAASEVWSLPLLSHIESDLRLSSKRTTVGGIALGKAAATISVKSGKISAQLASLAYTGGSAHGQMTVDFNGRVPQTTVRGKLVNAPLGDIFSALFGVRGIEGRATLTADLDATASPLQPTLQTLKGRIKLIADEPTTVALDLTSLSKQKIPSGQDGAYQIFLDASQRTSQLDSLEVDLKLDRGEATCQNLIAMFDDQIIRLACRADLATRKWNLRAAIHAQEKLTDRQTKPALVEPIQGRLISLDGYWATPQISIEDTVANAEEFAEILSEQTFGMHSKEIDAQFYSSDVFRP
ncbi:MAG: AsmA family protein [Hyphomicrobiaceae bacterium]